MKADVKNYITDSVNNFWKDDYNWHGYGSGKYRNAEINIYSVKDSEKEIKIVFFVKAEWCGDYSADDGKRKWKKVKDRYEAQLERTKDGYLSQMVWVYPKRLKHDF